MRTVCAEARCPNVGECWGGGTATFLVHASGFNNVDLEACERLGVTVARVPAYSPFAVAEYAVALMFALNRRIHRAHSRVREGNFSLSGLVGFDMHGKTAGVIGGGQIGQCALRILRGFGCQQRGPHRYPGLAGRLA